MKEKKKQTPTFKTIDRDDAVADSENTLSCECDKVSRLNSLCREEKKKKESSQHAFNYIGNIDLSQKTTRRGDNLNC